MTAIISLSDERQYSIARTSAVEFTLPQKAFGRIQVMTQKAQNNT